MQIPLNRLLWAQSSLAFGSVTIESNSHGRSVAGLVGESMGVCKPGAKLRNIASVDTLRSGTWSVLIAGSNDVADGG